MRSTISLPEDLRDFLGGCDPAVENGLLRFLTLDGVLIEEEATFFKGGSSPLIDVRDRFLDFLCGSIRTEVWLLGALGWRGVVSIGVLSIWWLFVFIGVNDWTGCCCSVFCTLDIGLSGGVNDGCFVCGLVIGDERSVYFVSWW